MSIATAIQNAQQKVAAAYTAVSSKGGTLPQTQDLNNLSTAINSISGGGGGETSKYGASINAYLGSVDENGVMQEPVGEPLELVFTGVKVINNTRSINVPTGRFARGNVTTHWQIVKSASFPDLEEVREDGLRDAFYRTGIESVSFPKLKYIAPTPGSSYNNYAFNSTFDNQPVWEGGIAKGGLKTVSFPDICKVLPSYGYGSFHLYLLNRKNHYTYLLSV